MEYLSTLDYGETYHIYNKSVGGVQLFKTEKDYFFFMKKLARFILPIADIYAYCLIPNHFHLLLKIKEYYEISNSKKSNNNLNWLTQIFSNFFISYSRSYNNIYKRQGRLFLQPFKRIKVDSNDYFTELVVYIHRNPIHHGLVSEYSDWEYSSYKLYLSSKKSIINKIEVLNYFENLDDFITYHNEYRYRFMDNESYME